MNTRSDRRSPGVTRRALLRAAGAAGAMMLATLPSPRPRAFGQETQPDETTVPCDRADAWAVFTPGGPAPTGTLAVTREPGTFREGTGAIEHRYVRAPGQVTLLGTSVLLTNLRVIDLEVWSQVATTIVVGVEDRDGATFHWITDLEAATWKRIRIGAHEFRLSSDSKVRKPALDPRRLGLGLAIADLGPAVGARGPNVLRIDYLHVTRDPLRAVRLPATIDAQTVEIAESGYARGPAVVRNSGTLSISAPRFALAGNVVADAGAFTVRRCALSLHGRYAHDLGLTGAHGAVLRFADSIVSGQYPSGVSLRERSRLEIVRTEFAGAALTVDVCNGCAVSLDRAKNPGECILSPGARISVTDSEAILLWLTTGAGARRTLALPDGAAIDAWSHPGVMGAEIAVRRSRGLLWGLISESGSDVTVERSRLVAVGVYFGRAGRQVISGIRNRRRVDNFVLGVSDRRLAFVGAEVEAWNFYAADGSDITLRDSTYGEHFASDTGRMTVERCTCDGSGGYVRAEGKSVTEIRQSHLIPDVVAVDEAALLLQNCTVDGSVRASGRARVRLVNTKVGGAVERFDGAVIERR